MRFMRLVVPAIAMMAASGMKPCEAQRKVVSAFAAPRPVASDTAGGAAPSISADAVRLNYHLRGRFTHTDDKDNDSLLNGAIIGVVAGGAVGLAMHGMDWYGEPSRVMMLLGGAAWGAAIGVFVDYIN